MWGLRVGVGASRAPWMTPVCVALATTLPDPEESTVFLWHEPFPLPQIQDSLRRSQAHQGDLTHTSGQPWGLLNVVPFKDQGVPKSR